MDLRELKGKQIALTRQIKRLEDGFAVQSQNSKRFYFVDEQGHCNCPDCEKNGVSKCKHSYAVEYFLSIKKTDRHGAITEQKIRLSYPQAWHTYNQAQTNEIKQFEALLSDLLESVPEPVQEGAGRPALSLREQLFCSVKKVYSKMSSRRAKGLFDEAKEKQLIEKSPYFNCVSALLNKEETTELLERLITFSALPLKAVESSFAVDSSGFRTTKFTEYCKDKHGIERKHEYLKAHIVCGVKTNIVCSAKITDETGADISQFPSLIQNTKETGFDIQEVSADKIYNSASNYNLVREVGGMPYIPFKSNTTATSHTGNNAKFWRRMYHYFQANQEEFSEHYHKRSNVETVFFMIKSKLGDCLKSKNFIAQKNELLCKILAHNIIVLINEVFELGIAPQFKPFQETSQIETQELGINANFKQ